MYLEFNFDGLVGPTHNYAGLARGNLASTRHRHRTSHPKAAALQGLAKMRALARLGVPQGVLPPLERPSVPALRLFGFHGEDDRAVLARAAREAPEILAACCSASSMWTANAATVAPSSDAEDRRLHLTPANLLSHLHRALEAEETAAVLRAIFRDPDRFVVHPPLPGGQAMRDEGAANHTRLVPEFGGSGLHVFVYGNSALGESATGPVRFPARQTLESFQAIARLHQLNPERVIFLQQNPAAVDSGVFHNDVIAVGHRGLLFHHEEAFAERKDALRRLDESYERINGEALCRIEVPAARVDVSTAVRTYLFNSQIVTVPGRGEVLVAPADCLEDPDVSSLIDEVVSDSWNPIGAVHYFDLRESMRNGGGPACLRQRIVMNEEERAAIRARVIPDEILFGQLEAWIDRHYRTDLDPADLADPQLLEETRRALDDLTDLLNLGSLYSFQK
ncbi:MAG: N-succinylarginine dihydrolase [Opitutaceae bacterium]